MDKYAEVYRNLREVVSNLGNLQGQTSTNELISGLDQTWRCLVRTKKAMIETLKEQGKINNAKDIPIGDFYSLYCAIHYPKRETIGCGSCLSQVEKSLTECPFCGSSLNASQESPYSAEIDFSIPDAPPNWDINLSTDGMFKERDYETENLEEIKPITKRDDIPGPKGAPTRKNRRRPKMMKRSTRDTVSWIKKRELGKMVPFSLNQLKNLNQHDLRLLSMLMPGAKWRDVQKKSIDELIRYIRAKQGTEPIHPGPPPYGTLPKEVLNDN